MERSWPLGMKVERGKIQEFSRVVRATNPAYGAKNSGVEGPELLAPPTYPVVLNHWGPSGSQALEEVGCDLKRVLHGEESYRYPSGPLREGQVVTGSMRYLGDEIKTNRRGEQLRIVKFVTELRDQSTGELAVAIQRSIIEKL